MSGGPEAAQTADRAKGNEFLSATGFPPPDGAETIWLNNAGHDVRLVFAPAPTGADKPRGAVLLCTGYNEYIEKYFETARDLQARGFAVGVLDWPGQGGSQRLIDKPRVGYVRTFDTCVAAQKLALEAVKARAAGPYIVMAHSMGGAITLESLRQKAIDPVFAFLCAPMLGLRVGFGARAAMRIMRTIGMSKAALGSESRNNTFETNIFTHDERRWSMNKEMQEQKPDYLLRAPTVAWVNAALDLYERWRKPRAFADVTTPVLIASAGGESLVSNQAQARVAKAVGENAKLVTIPEARHEILMEADRIRDLLWKEFDAMCAEYGV